MWLDVSGATDSGTLSIPDRMGGSPATQATGANKPTLGTTTNGLAKLTGATATFLSCPIRAGLADVDYFGLAMWIRPADVTLTTPDLFNITRTGAAGQADFDRISIRQSLDDISCLTWLPPSPSSNVRSSRTESTRGILQSNVWKFITIEYIGVAATELQRVVYKEAGTVLPPQYLPTFAQAQGTALDTPSTLIAATGSAILLNRTTAAANGFVGDVTDIFCYDPRSMTPDALVQLAQYEVPVG